MDAIGVYASLSQGLTLHQHTLDYCLVFLYHCHL